MNFTINHQKKNEIEAIYLVVVVHQQGVAADCSNS